MNRGIKLNPCPSCGGEIVLMCGATRVPQIYVRCRKCRYEYDLPNVKLKFLKHKPTKISKTTLREAEKAWNRRTDK